MNQPLGNFELEFYRQATGQNQRKGQAMNQVTEEMVRSLAFRIVDELTRQNILRTDGRLAYCDATRKICYKFISEFLSEVEEGNELASRLQQPPTALPADELAVEVWEEFSWTQDYAQDEVARLIEFIAGKVQQPLEPQPGPPKILTIEAARKLNVCRVCREPARPGKDNPFVYNYGAEFAHRECLDDGTLPSAEPPEMPVCYNCECEIEDATEENRNITWITNGKHFAAHSNALQCRNALMMKVDRLEAEALAAARKAGE